MGSRGRETDLAGGTVLGEDEARSQDTKAARDGEAKAVNGSSTRMLK